MNLNSKSRFHQKSIWKHINCTAYNVHIGFMPTRNPRITYKPLHPNIENPNKTSIKLESSLRYQFYHFKSVQNLIKPISRLSIYQTLKQTTPIKTFRPIQITFNVKPIHAQTKLHDLHQISLHFPEILSFTHKFHQQSIPINKPILIKFKWMIHRAKF